MKREEVLSRLRENEGALRKAGIARLSLFGSTARDEAERGSDVDLLAAFEESRRISLLDIAGMVLELEAMLGASVDLVEEGAMRPQVRSQVEKDLVRAF